MKDDLYREVRGSAEGYNLSLSALIFMKSPLWRWVGLLLRF